MSQQPEIGRLNRRVQILTRSDAPVGEYDLATSYALVKEVWCSLQPVSAGSYWNGKQIGEEVTHKITVRREEGVTDPESITTALELDIDGQRYRPVRPLDYDGQRRFTIIEAVQLGEAP